MSRRNGSTDVLVRYGQSQCQLSNSLSLLVDANVKPALESSKRTVLWLLCLCFPILSPPSHKIKLKVFAQRAQNQLPPRPRGSPPSSLLFLKASMTSHIPPDTALSTNLKTQKSIIRTTTPPPSRLSRQLYSHGTCFFLKLSRGCLCAAGFGGGGTLYPSFCLSVTVLAWIGGRNTHY
jgi:hypothetical protein